MKFIDYSLRNPVVVCVGVLFLLLFGYLALRQMPYALTPNITKPTISVITTWPGATPYEMEKEVTQRQERFLKNLSSLTSMTSTSREGVSVVNLEFHLDTDMKKALLDINSKLSQVRGYPPNINNPVVKTSGENLNPVVYLFIKSATQKPVKQSYTYVNEEILKLYERLEGVGLVDLVGGTALQVQVVLDTQRLAFYNLTIDEVIAALRDRNVDVSAGNLDYGQRAYRVRTIGVYENARDIYNTIVKTIDTQAVHLRDLASVIETYESPTVPNTHNNDETISLQIRPDATANVLEVIEKVRRLTNKLNNNQLKDHGLFIDWGRDSQGFIQNAISLVKQNILIGILLASLVLYAFLRSLSSVFVVSVILPISILSSFIVLNFMDRSLTVILLAGVSFAVSMIVDSSIVVVENIHRHRSLGKRFFESCIDASREVLGALFASTVTTVAIFIPIIGLKDEVGQLFSDIALAASSALLLSLPLCLIVVPTLQYSLVKFLSNRGDSSVAPSHYGHLAAPLRKILGFLARGRPPKWLLGIFLRPRRLLDLGLLRIGIFLNSIVKACVHACLKSALRRIICVLGFMALSLAISIALFPKLDYLPKGTQNFLVAYVQIPQGLSYQERLELMQELHARHAPYLLSNGFEGNDKYPAIKDFYISAGTTSLYFYVIAATPSRVRDLIPLMTSSIDSVPNISGTVVEQGIFSSAGISESVQVNITGNDMDSMRASTQEFVRLAKQHLPGVRIRVLPSLDLGNRELNLYPDMHALAINGLSVKSFGNIIDVVVGGKKIGDYRDSSGRIIDLVLKTDNTTQSPEDILYSQIYAPSGEIIPLSSLASAHEELGPSQIRHLEQNRSLLVNMNASSSLSLQEVLDIIENKIKVEMEKSGALRDNEIVLSGSANKLHKLAAHLSGGFLLALVITYLLLTALYSNFLYPLIIIVTVPFAIAGGLIALFLVNKYIAPQNLDVLTMLGFIILVGSVVNNAILIVYQSLINLRQHHLPVYESVYDATISRIRPIYMSMLTSLLALAPLIFTNGSGSEIYRGLGAVIAGGLFFSTIISVLVIPSLLIFALRPPRESIV